MNDILIGEKYICDGMWGTFVVATKEEDLSDIWMDVENIYRDIRSVKTNNHYQSDDMFID